jgi:hypothetical protein
MERLERLNSKIKTTKGDKYLLSYQDGKFEFKYVSGLRNRLKGIKSSILDLNVAFVDRGNLDKVLDKAEIAIPEHIEKVRMLTLKGKN